MNATDLMYFVAQSGSDRIRVHEAEAALKFRFVQ
jgi:hypothetical protein